MAKAKFRILLVGGGTGGHTAPLVAVAQELLALAAQSESQVIELKFMGDGELLKSEAGKLGLRCTQILSPKWRRYFSVLNFIDVLKVPVGFIQSLFSVWSWMPDVVFAKGGYASFLPALAAKLMVIPIAIHESDSIPGKTNLYLSRFAKKVFVAFDAAKNYFKLEKTEVVGNPIRREIFSGYNREQAVAVFGLDPARPVLLITGASQGAKIINDILLLSIVELAFKFQIIHQTGVANFKEVNDTVAKIIEEGKSSYGKTITDNYRVYPAFDAGQMSLAYSAADVVVSRAGSSIFEIAATGKPAVVIPLKNSASNHQLQNAKEFAKYGAIMVEEDNLSPHILIREISQAYERRQEIGISIRSFASTDAASKIARSLLNLLN